MSTIGSMSMLDPLQELYSMQMTSAMQPYMKQTVSGLADLGDNAYNTFQQIPDWNRYVNEKYVEPTMYDLNKKVGDLGHSKELFSSGYQNRVADLKGSTNANLRSMIGDEMMSQRQGQISGMEQGYQRQLSALKQFNSIMGAPLSYQGQENTVQPMTLFDSIGKLLQ
jgi:hypothetical protein